MKQIPSLIYLVSLLFYLMLLWECISGVIDLVSRLFVVFPLAVLYEQIQVWSIRFLFSCFPVYYTSCLLSAVPFCLGVYTVILNHNILIKTTAVWLKGFPFLQPSLSCPEHVRQVWRTLMLVVVIYGVVP